jgi:hypothetical protein
MVSFCKDIRISRHKSFEIQLELGDSGLAEDFFEFMCRWTRMCDHAGLTVRLSIIKLFWLNIMICDNRHWNDDADRWYRDDESQFRENDDQ